MCYRKATTVYMDAAATFAPKGMGDPLDGDRFPLARAGTPGGAS